MRHTGTVQPLQALVTCSQPNVFRVVSTPPAVDSFWNCKEENLFSIPNIRVSNSWSVVVPTSECHKLGPSKFLPESDFIVLGYNRSYWRRATIKYEHISSVLQLFTVKSVTLQSCCCVGGFETSQISLNELPPRRRLRFLDMRIFFWAARRSVCYSDSKVTLTVAAYLK